MKDTGKPTLPPNAYVPSLICQDQRVTKTDLRVFIALCAHRNKGTGRCFPAVERIAEETGIDKRHVRRSRNRLRKLGYISWEQKFTENGKTLSCEYTIAGMEEEQGVKEGGLNLLLPGGETCPSSRGGISPPNIEGNIEEEHSVKEHTASFGNDAVKGIQKNGKRSSGGLTRIAETNPQGAAAIIERRMKERAPTEGELAGIETAMDAALDAVDEMEPGQIGHVARVYEESLEKAALVDWCHLAEPRPEWDDYWAERQARGITEGE